MFAFLSFRYSKFGLLNMLQTSFFRCVSLISDVFFSWILNKRFSIPIFYWKSNYNNNHKFHNMYSNETHFAFLDWNVLWMPNAGVVESISSRRAYIKLQLILTLFNDNSNSSCCRYVNSDDESLCQSVPFSYNTKQKMMR